LASGEILTQVEDGIRKSTVLLADLTGNNLNVFYEMGIAHGIHGRTHVILATPSKDPKPFDVGHFRMLEYDVDDPDWGSKLQREITQALKDTVEARRTVSRPTPQERSHVSQPLVEQLASELSKVRDDLRDLRRELLPEAGFMTATTAETPKIVENNPALDAEVRRYVENLPGHPGSFKAVVIQYSAVNAKDIVRDLLWKGIDVDLYVVAEALNRHQQARVAETIDGLPNHCRPHDLKASLGKLRVYRYSAPGSIRAVMLTNTSGEGLLSLGVYLYEKVPIQGQTQLDVRGGELPTTLFFRSSDPRFGLLVGMVEALTNNWKDERVVEEALVWPPEKQL
jgi:hypothetical protein